jgi:hypothetical protein
MLHAIVVEKIKTHTFYVQKPFAENLAVYEIV